MISRGSSSPEIILYMPTIMYIYIYICISHHFIQQVGITLLAILLDDSPFFRDSLPPIFGLDLGCQVPGSLGWDNVATMPCLNPIGGGVII